MPRVSNDPYSDFALRILNTCRVAIGQSYNMSDREYEIVKGIRAMLLRMDPTAEDMPICTIIHRELHRSVS